MTVKVGENSLGKQKSCDELFFLVPPTWIWYLDLYGHYSWFQHQRTECSCLNMYLSWISLKTSVVWAILYSFERQGGYSFVRRVGTVNGVFATSGEEDLCRLYLLIFLFLLLENTCNISTTWSLTDSTSGDSGPQKESLLYAAGLQTEMHLISCTRILPVTEITHRNHTSRTL